VGKRGLALARCGESKLVAWWGGGVDGLDAVTSVLILSRGGFASKGFLGVLGWRFMGVGVV
jgi:hypothetical protein